MKTDRRLRMNAKLRKLLAVAAGVLCSLTAMFALAAGAWSGRTLIDRLTVRVDQTVIVVNESGTWKNLDLCDNDTRIVLLPPGAPGAAVAYKEVYASLLGAHLTKREINAFLDGCTLIGSQTFPVIAQVAVY
jgi:hypothetical protein